MKRLTEYIYEKIRSLAPNVKGVIVFDIDDTLLKVDKNAIAVYKKEPGKPVKRMSTEDYAKDPDVQNHPEWFDISEFRNPTKVYNSIISGTPLLKNLKIMDAYIEAGYDFCFLTARSCEDVVKQALDDFLLRRTSDGTLKKLGDSFKKTISHAVNDQLKKYPGKTDYEKKANVLKDICKKYDKVVFVDDDKKNVRAAKDLKISNLTVIKAWDE